MTHIYKALNMHQVPTQIIKIIKKKKRKSKKVKYPEVQQELHTEMVYKLNLEIEEESNID